MKKIITSLLIINTLYAQNDLDKTSLDMFLFKIGFKSLVNEVEVEKNKTKQNTNDIKQLKKQVENMIDLNSKNKINNSFNINNENNNIDKIESLQAQVEELKKQLNNLYIKKNNKSKINSKLLIDINNTQIPHVGVDSANIYLTTNTNSKIIKTLNRNDNIKIKFCNSYGWCKVLNSKGYIAKYKLKF